MHSHVTLLALASALFAPALSAQDFKQEISLVGIGSGPGYSFGIAHETDSDRIFVAVSGGVGANNNQVAILDPAAKSVVNTITVGDFPEDFAFAYDGGGNLDVGIVTNSSGSSVSFFDASDTVIAAEPLPDPFGFGAFPYGVTLSEDGSTFYVTSLDGSGGIYALDVATRSRAAALDLDINFRSGSRLLATGGKLLVPNVAFGAGGSTGGMLSIDPATNTIAWDHVLTLADATYTAAGQDVVELNDGTLIVAGLGFDGRLYHMTQSGELLRTIKLSVFGGGGQGLALSPDGLLLAVCDFSGDTISFVNLNGDAFEEIALVETSLLGYSRPNDAVFHNGELYVTFQASEAVVVFENLPATPALSGFAGSIALSDTAPVIGGNTTATVTGPGKVALLLSKNDVATTLQGIDLLIGPAVSIEAVGQGQAQKPYAVPNVAGLRGRNVFFQGVVDLNGTPAVTAPRVAVIQ